MLVPEISISGITDLGIVKLKVYLSALEFEAGLKYVRGLSEKTMLSGLSVVLIVRFAGTPASEVESVPFVAKMEDVLEMTQWNSAMLALKVSES